MKNYLFIILFVSLYSVTYGQREKINKQAGWLFYWGGAVVWFPSHKITRKTKEYCFFDSKSQYTNGLKVNYIPDALLYKSIAKGYKISEVILNSSSNINNRPITDDSVWVIPVKAWSNANTIQPSGLSPIDTLAFRKGNTKLVVSLSFETDYEISGLELLRKKDMRRLKRVKNYMIYPPH